MLFLLMACAPDAWFATDSAIDFDVASLGWVTTPTTDIAGGDATLFQLVLASGDSACDALAAGATSDDSLFVWGTFDDTLYGSSWAQGGGLYTKSGACEPIQTGSGQLDLAFLDDDAGIAAGDMWGTVTAGSFSVAFDADRCDVDAQAVPSC